MARRGGPGPALTIGIPLVVLGSAGFLVWKLVYAAPSPTSGSTVVQGPKPVESEPKTSRVRPPGPSGKVIRIAGDPWSGYSTFRNEPKLKARLAKNDITLNYIDKKYYDQNLRMAALESGEIDLAVTTIDAFLQHGARHKVDGQYPGVILWNIDESNGGDAIFLAKNRKSFDALGPGDIVCYSTGTPSEHLWDFASISFSHLDNLKTNNGEVAQDCWDKLKAKTVQVAVLWQPLTAVAEKEGYRKIFATGPQADDIIIDVVVASRDYVKRESSTIAKLARAYFSTIDEYTKDTAEHARFITEDCGDDCKKDAALGTAVLSGIDFLTYEENMQLWWGKRGKQAKMPGRIEKTGRILVLKGKLDRGDLPRPDTILDDTFLVDMDPVGVGAGPAPQELVDQHDASRLERDEAAKHDRSKDMGQLKLPAVHFGDGSYRIDPNAQSIIATIKERLESFPGPCIRIYGYTSSTGDVETNKVLSMHRARAIAKELQSLDAAAYPDARFDVRGFGPENLIMRNGVEDPVASRRTEFTLYNCARH